MKVTMTITGSRPMLLHNGRLANPLDPHTRALKALTSKRAKTDDDLAAIALTEARGSAYETAEGLLGLPVDNVHRSLVDAAKAFKKGTTLTRALVPLSDIEPIEVDGAKVVADDYVTWDNIDTRTVRNQQNRVLRARPIVRPPWKVTHSFELMTEELDLAELERIAERAGQLVGVGDFRPRFGTFAAEIEVAA